MTKQRLHCELLVAGLRHADRASSLDGRREPPLELLGLPSRQLVDPLRGVDLLGQPLVLLREVPQGLPLELSLPKDEVSASPRQSLSRPTELGVKTACEALGVPLLSRTVVGGRDSRTLGVER